MFFLIKGTFTSCSNTMISNYDLSGFFYDRLCLFHSSFIKQFLLCLHIRLRAVLTMLANVPLFLTFKLLSVILKTIILYTRLIQKCLNMVFFFWLTFAEINQNQTERTTGQYFAINLLINTSSMLFSNNKTPTLTSCLLLLLLKASRYSALDIFQCFMNRQ